MRAKTFFSNLAAIKLLAGSASARDLQYCVFVTLITATAAVGCIALTRQNSGIAAVWLSNGILLAVLLMTPEQRLRNLLTVSSLLGNIVVNVVMGRSAVDCLFFAFANTAEVTVAYFLVGRFPKSENPFLEIPSLVKFCVFAGLIAPAATASLAAYPASLHSTASFMSCWSEWFRADALGILIITPAVVLLSEGKGVIQSNRFATELAVLLIMTVFASLGVFIERFPYAVFAVFPVFLIMSCRMGPAVVSAAALVLMYTLVLAISQGLTPSLLGKGADALTAIEFAQTLIVVAYLTALPVADVISGQELLRSALSEEVLQREQLTQDLLAREQRIKQQNQILEVERNRLRDAIDILPEGLVMLDPENRYITWNKKYEEMYPLTAHLMHRGKTFEEVTREGLQLGMYSEAIGREEAWLKDRLESLKNPGVAREQVLADGRHLLIQERRTSEGGVAGLRIDITDMKRREASTRLLFENNPVPMLVTSEATHEILAANQAAVVQYGYKKSDFKNVRWWELLGLEPQAASEFLGLDSGHVGVEGRIVKMFKRDGSPFEAEIYASSFQLDNVQSSLVAVIDVTKRRNAEKHAAYMALHDALTGLPNRNLLAERMQLAMARARRGDKVALLFLDLDHFKSVNDTFGHSVGDELLKCVSDRLKRCVRETDTVARLGGDEFAILLTGASIPEGAARVATRIVNSIRMPYRIAGQEINCGVSVGIAIAPDDTTNTAELFRFADLALYSVKEDRRGSYRFFQIDMDSRVRHRIAIENELKQAILNNELELDYQPIVSKTGKTTCVEALVRWQHPERARVAPGAFIPLAEETGLILDIGKFVLFQACLDAANWPDDVAVSVNLSALEIENPDLVKTIREALDTSGLAPHRLQVEITESVLMKDVDRAVQTLAELAAVGIQLAMDDFGVGYSSLSMLRKFPFKKLQIDRAFVRDLETSQEARSILATIVKLAGTLNMKATAEGIETVEQHDIADRCGCSEFQGYLFCKPISASDVARRLQFQAKDEHHAA